MRLLSEMKLLFLPRVSLLPVAVAALVLGVAFTAQAQLTVNGAGATFPNPLYTKWFDAYAKVDPSVRFNYQAIGSGAGKKQITEQTVDFGASDGPMSDEELAKAPGKILHIPTVAGAVAVTYNVPGLTGLQLDGPTLADIFLGKIRKWNDPAIVKLNAKAKLPKSDIVVVHRSDGSGTSYIWTDYLSTVSPEWKEKVGKNTAVQWPVGLGAKGNEGVAGQVRQMPGSIGYVEIAYAFQNHMAMAQMINKAGKPTSPNVETVAAAMAGAQIPDDFRFSMVNADGPTAYPICGATWLLVYAEQKDHEKGQKLVAFLRWMIADGQKMAAKELHDLQYAPLPEAVQKRVAAEIDGIKP